VKQLITRSGFWLAALILLEAGLLAWLGRFTPQLMADSASYLEYDASSLRQALTDVRTFGYPLFLRAVGRTEFVPFAQYIAAAAAVWIFYLGLISVGYRRWTALWCAGTLLVGRAVIDLGSFLVSDSLAISLTIAGAGCFLRIVSRPAGGLAWIAFVVLTFLAWQVRPASLFLIPLWPILGFVLDRHLVGRGNGLRRQTRRAAAIALAAAVPFLAFCTFRWFVVGHWGLVSFGGYNVVGIAGQIVDEDVVSELPPDLQPLGARIIRERERLDAAQADADFLAMEARFNDTVWQAAVPAAEDLTDGDPVAVNQLLSRFSLAVIERRPRRYLGWLLGNANHARQQLITLTVFDKGTFCLGVAYLFLQTVSLVGRRSETIGGTHAPDLATRRLERLLLFWMAIFHSALCCLLVILVEPANDRYMTAGMVFFPPVIAVWVAHAAERTFPRVAAAFDR
jgi:hypothetical protein